MLSNQEIRRSAREQLGNNIFGSLWMTAVLVCIVSTVIIGVAGNIIPGIGVLLITGPMFYGCDKLFLRQAAYGEEMTLEGIFDGFRDDFGGIFIMCLLRNIFVTLWGLLFVIPGIVKGYAYSQATYIKAEHPEYDWRECLTTSQTMMKGHKMELFLLDLSFIGWWIVGALCLGIGSVWVSAYHGAAHARFYLELTSIRYF